jgi:hypothetical protein
LSLLSWTNLFGHIILRGYFCWRCRRCHQRPLRLVRSISQLLQVGLTQNLVCMLLSITRSAVHKKWYSALLFFESLPFVIFHTLFLSGSFLINYKVIDLKLHKILLRKSAVHKNWYSALLNFWVIASYFHTLFLSGSFLLTIKAIDWKLHRMIDLIKKKCIAQELILCTSYFLSYCPLFSYFIFVRVISPKQLKLLTWNFIGW